MSETKVRVGDYVKVWAYLSKGKENGYWIGVVESLDPEYSFNIDQNKRILCECTSLESPESAWHPIRELIEVLDKVHGETIFKLQGMVV